MPAEELLVLVQQFHRWPEKREGMPESPRLSCDLPRGVASYGGFAVPLLRGNDFVFCYVGPAERGVDGGELWEYRSDAQGASPCGAGITRPIRGAGWTVMASGVRAASLTCRRQVASGRRLLLVGLGYVRLRDVGTVAQLYFKQLDGCAQEPHGKLIEQHLLLRRASEFDVPELLAHLGEVVGQLEYDEGDGDVVEVVMFRAQPVSEQPSGQIPLLAGVG